MTPSGGVPVLDIAELRVTYPGPPPVGAVDGISLSVGRGEVLGILGESGSGKSTMAKALLGLTTDAQVEGRVRLGDRDLVGLDEKGWREVRWKRIALAFQSTASLNPVLRVGAQLVEPLHVHLGLPGDAAERRSVELLTEVGLGEWAAGRYPRELSGGQRRLVLLAMALACRPDVAILDEPTAGLDPSTRNHVLDLLGRVRDEAGTSFIVMSHDADALEAVADRVAVLYRGWLAEVGPGRRVLADPRNPYSWALLNARPTLASVKDLRGIRGSPPDPTTVVRGCPFYGRCQQGREGICTEDRPPMLAPAGEDGERVVACARGGVVSLLSARGMRKTYPGPGHLLHRTRVAVVDDVDLDVREGEVVGLVGSTGAGKSTLGMMLVRLLDADGGTVEFDGADVLQAGGAELKALRARVQMLFQDPFESLSPRLTVAQAVQEPLEVQGIGDPKSRIDRVRATVADCRLPTTDAFLARHTHELSGGQLQRVALARALVLEPELLVADEAVSMLDPSEQAKMIQLLKHLQVERGMSMIFISHDLSVVLRVADRVVVLERGRIVEEGPGSRLLVAPQHPLTRALLDASGRDLLFSEERHRILTEELERAAP
ncbi:MAG TPA: ABC transporter ATP-binding protein [Acidimicrobiales bacterium]|nr:ABC transporter ATP-binding protein [Acidimicrobiales bacterium]